MKSNKYKIIAYCVLILGMNLVLLPAKVEAEAVIDHNIYWAYNQAWLQSGEQDVFEKKAKEIDAKMRLSRGLAPEPFELGVQYADDRLFDDEGKQEYEITFEMPLWRWNQRKTRALHVKYLREGMYADIHLTRLEIAGEVREAYWSYIIAWSNIQLAQRALNAAKDIAADVERRVKAGDLAKLDGLLAKETVLEAKSELLESMNERFSSTQQFITLTGSNPPKQWTTEQLKEIEINAHPMIQKLHREIQIKQAQLQMVRVEKGESKKLELFVSSERDDRVSEDHKQLGLGFRMPLGVRRENKAEVSEITTEISEAEQRLIRERKRIIREIRTAEKILELARASQGLAEKQNRLNANQHEITLAAFNVGEVSLQILLESLSRRQKAEQNMELRRIETARAISFLNQSRGLLPEKTIKE